MMIQQPTARTTMQNTLGLQISLEQTAVPKSHVAYGFATHLVVLDDDGKVKRFMRLMTQERL